MLEAQVTVLNPLGLHARAAALLVKSAARFKSRISISRADVSTAANAKSILSVLTLAASSGTQILLTVEGPDEHEALETITNLFENGFGEL
jgi:phosphocarrier protein